MTKLRQQIVELWVDGVGLLETARRLGCDKSTVLRARQSTECVELYNRQCVESMSALVPHAISTLHQVLTDPDERMQYKLAAAKEVLDRANIRYVPSVDNNEPLEIVVSYE